MEINVSVNLQNEQVDDNGLTEAQFLAQYNPGDWPRPSVTTDVVVCAVDESGQGHKVYILLIKRGGHPCLGKWALPGGFVDPDETVGEAAARELMEETGIQVDVSKLKQLHVFSKPRRDPRTWVITCTHLAVISAESREALVEPHAGDDAAEARWFDVRVEYLDKTESSAAAATKQVHLLLSNNDAHLSATLEQDPTNNEFIIIENNGLAFDHAEMLAWALGRISPNLRERNAC
jgi:ADP-ribose pyrophosphatase YjhB (NUDIX family)